MHINLQTNEAFLGAQGDMKKLELKIRKSNFLFNIISCMSGGKLHPQKREFVVVEVKNYRLLENGKEEKVNI